ncbi:hypothetical protein A8W25_24980 [Streptomyces sp. ERV7]|nr:hypothetical protein A8W25_24980 [Streptomyces sp. ERV7]
MTPQLDWLSAPKQTAATRKPAYPWTREYPAIATPQPSHSAAITRRLPQRSAARPAGMPAATPNSPAMVRPKPTWVVPIPQIRVK